MYKTTCANLLQIPNMPCIVHVNIKQEWKSENLIQYGIFGTEEIGCYIPKKTVIWATQDSFQILSYSKLWLSIMPPMVGYSQFSILSSLSFLYLACRKVLEMKILFSGTEFWTESPGKYKFKWLGKLRLQMIGD